ncbi:MAG: electron transfer flavoprotein subunit alpha/FixB family protein [Halanaeroarchaeum sp.]
MTAAPLGVYLESSKGTVESVGYEILGKAREIADELGTSVTAFLAGSPANLEGLPAAAITRGADHVIAIEDDVLEQYRPETYASVVETAVEDVDPFGLLVPATHNGIDLAGRLAVRFDTGMNADVVELGVKDGQLVGSVPAFGGDILARVKVSGRPQMSTVRPGVFAQHASDPDRDGSIETLEPGLGEDDVLTEIVDREVGERVDLPSATVVVAAGQGFDGDLELATELVDELGATLGVTRPLADAGLVSRDRQIGSTGYSLDADLAIVAGVSGSVYFSSGLDDVDTVVAINVDADEPIFEYADYCVEGDLFEVLPALLESLQEREVPQ